MGKENRDSDEPTRLAGEPSGAGEAVSGEDETLAPKKIRARSVDDQATVVDAPAGDGDSGIDPTVVLGGDDAVATLAAGDRRRTIDPTIVLGQSDADADTVVDGPPGEAPTEVVSPEGDATLVGGEGDAAAGLEPDVGTVVPGAVPPIGTRTRQSNEPATARDIPLDAPTQLGPGSAQPAGTRSTTPRKDTESLLGDQAASIAVGRIVDQRFVLEEELGRGGMGIVFRARDLVKEQARDPNPYVAVKILGATFKEHPDAWISLQREVKKTQSLAHPRIVTIHDFQIDRDTGLPFCQMEELRGKSLDRVIKENPEGIEDRDFVNSILLGIADGLDYAHRRGIVHSDLKPPNVFLTDNNEVKILDFGIARAVPGTGDDDEWDAGSMGALTPAYASPEMFEGKPPDPADDVFALGLIAMRLYTGQHPFKEVLRTRKPACEARDQGLQVERLKYLKRNQWKAIEASLAFEREDRLPNAGTFLSQFRRRSQLPLYLGTSLVLLSAVLVWSIWIREVEMEPEIPFEQLPVERQQAFTGAVEEGWLAHRLGDYNGALIYFTEAYDLHPFNPDAMAGLDAIVQLVLDMPVEAGTEDARRKLERIKVLQDYPALAERADLMEARKELESGG